MMAVAHPPCAANHDMAHQALGAAKEQRVGYAVAVAVGDIEMVAVEDNEVGTISRGEGAGRLSKCAGAAFGRLAPKIAAHGWGGFRGGDITPAQ